uniref:Uncharacterized protein n=1 Tax=Arundo donax TaxID=35708 RepID=A0A0A9HN78_ARUDO
MRHHCLHQQEAEQGFRPRSPTIHRPNAVSCRQRAIATAPTRSLACVICRCSTGHHGSHPAQPTPATILTAAVAPSKSCHHCHGQPPMNQILPPKPT